MTITPELHERLTQINLDQSGNFEVNKTNPDIRSEFIWLCREHYRNSPDMGCGSCVMKYVVKILNDFQPKEEPKKRTRKNKVTPTEEPTEETE
jgi:hypothetical protein